MNTIAWSFSDFVRWLRTKCEALQRQGAVVELAIHESGRGSARLRIEHGKRLSELTVWDDGFAHMAVVDLLSGGFVFERDGVSLANLPVDSGLKEFLDHALTEG